ncbi:hypothetical protein ABLE93_25485 [Xanthobacter sp. KR7-65]|uniref:hypothetical protein n=1 Tax=Xanthobacter sp. KR7-65 TaxID=3156612 RepID=UPI0032B4A617
MANFCISPRVKRKVKKFIRGYDEIRRLEVVISEYPNIGRLYVRDSYLIRALNFKPICNKNLPYMTAIYCVLPTADEIPGADDEIILIDIIRSPPVAQITLSEWEMIELKSHIQAIWAAAVAESSE